MVLQGREREDKKMKNDPTLTSFSHSLSLSARPPPGTGDDKKTRTFVLG